MATLTFDFSACSDPALALRIANLVTQDIERLERQVFATQTSWQRLDKPFKAHYALKLVNMTDERSHAEILAALPSYEKNATNYKRDSKRRGRPLTEYSHKTGSNAMPVQVNQTKPVEAAEVTTSDEALDNEILKLLGQSAQEQPLSSIMERARKRAQQERQTKPREQQDTKPDDEADSETENTQSPVDQAMKALADALKASQQPQAGPLDEDRVREIAREEDQTVMDAVKLALDTVSKPNIITVEHTYEDETPKQIVDLGVQHRQFEMLMKLCQIKNGDGYQFPVWLPGPAGSGKTTAARNVARALNIPFQFTGAVDNPYQLLGFRDAAGVYHRTSFREAFEGAECSCGMK